MISSRSLDDLTPEMKAKALKHIEVCKNLGIQLLIYCTYRDNEAQAEVYAQGRTKPGKIITEAKPGESYHNYRIAYDCVPLINGKPEWNSSAAVWSVVGKLGEEVGLEWAGRWKGRLKETVHFQEPGHTLRELQARKN